MLGLWPLESYVQRIQQLWSVEIKSILSSQLAGVMKSVKELRACKLWTHIPKNELGVETALYGVRSVREQTHSRTQIKGRSRGRVALQWICMDFVQRSWRVAPRDKEGGTQETNGGAKRENNSWQKAAAALCCRTPWQAFSNVDASKKNRVKLGSGGGLGCERKQQKEANASM